MAKQKRKPSPSKNGRKPEKEVSELGRVLRKLAEQYRASGGKLYTLREIQREIEDNRSGR